MQKKSCRKAMTSARNRVRAAAKAKKSLQACERRVLGRDHRQGAGYWEDMLAVSTKCSKQLTESNKKFSAFDKATAKALVVCKDPKEPVIKNLYTALGKTSKKLGVKR